MYAKCMYDACIYMTLEFDPDACIYDAGMMRNFFVLEGRTNGRTNKAIHACMCDACHKWGRTDGKLNSRSRISNQNSKDLFWLVQ